ncbi:MAG: DUF4262 domain-containing protein [Clostridiales bacterium]|nr:DUF4262 domain-containing protein [Clostridiales bacterium]
MGYDIRKTNSKFHVKAEHASLVAVKLDKIGYGYKFDSFGNIIDTWSKCDKLGDEFDMFQKIASYVDEGSFLEYMGEDGAKWRWIFKNGKCIEVKASSTWSEEQNEKETESNPNNRDDEHIKAKKEVDWIIHMVIGEYCPGGIINSHTHGMEQYKHPNFQLVLPLNKEQIMMILNTICLEVQDGRRFCPGKYSGEIFSCDFRLEIYRETGPDLLRLIFPDPKMWFPEDPLCEAPYKYQTQKAFEI